MKPSINYSVIITAFGEEKTIGRAIKALLPQIDFSKGELWVVAPDEPTLEVAKGYPQVKILKDEGKGKPAALNLAASRAGGEILVLTDGDVCLGREALEKILVAFKNSNIGLATGQPKPVNKRNSLFGFWAFCLTAVAHQLRLKKSAKGEYFDGSGYLLALRRKYRTPIPPSCLTEDVFLSQETCLKGGKLVYVPQAVVWVKFPTNFSDWKKQKVRSVGGAGQKRKDSPSMRGFKNELKESFFFLTLPRSPKEWFWLLLLFLARLYLWLLIFWKLKVRRMPREKIWLRTESTK
ncbi:glycosyltransferase [Candidatus Shapirobacteria bacterium]|nr:glycosyltransferase [Candidatus Shapirobacteria bacterium]